MPPVSEQHAIGDALRAAIAVLEENVRAIEECRSRVDLLDRAALAKAFRGELVPQEPDKKLVAASIAINETTNVGAAHARTRARSVRSTPRAQMDGDT